MAEERDHDKWPDDSQRPLTRKSAKRMRRTAEGMRALNLSFDVIYTSPFVRAKQTADIVATVFDAAKKLRETETLAVDGNPEELTTLINNADAAFESVLLVGHEPYLSDLVSKLVCGDSSSSLTLKKGALCKLTVAALTYGRCATLDWLLPPGVSTKIK